VSPPPGEKQFSEKRLGGKRQDRLGGVLALLVTLTAAPVAAITVPNTVSNVLSQASAELGLSGDAQVGLYRAGGLALPGLLFAVPVGAVLARRLPSWIVLTAGLALVVGAEAGAPAAGSVPLLGALRIAQGVGAGLALPASLAVVWARARALWAGALVAALLTAMPVMLAVVPAEGEDWRPVFQPGLPLVGAALAAAGLYGLVRGRRRELPAARLGERTQLLLPVVPATGFAVLAVVTTYNWSQGAQLIVAGVGLAALLGLALVGSRDATAGSPYGVAVVAVGTGLLTLPIAAPMAGLLSTRTGAQQVPLIPFAVAAGTAVVGALAGGRLGGKGRSVVAAGQGLMVVAVMVFLTTGPESGTRALAVPLGLLGAGAGLSLGAALSTASLGAALFGLTLLFPALLTGELAVGALQVARVNAAIKAGTGAAGEVYALTAAFRTWLVMAGVAAVITAGATAFAARRRPGPGLRGVPAPRQPADETATEVPAT